MRRLRLHTVAYDGPGQLSVMARPHARTMARALRALRRRGAATVVSTLTERELAVYRLTDQWRAAADAGLDYFWWPIPEHGVPARADAARFLPELATRLRDGEHVVVHCNYGRGRSTMVAAALLAELGVRSPGVSFARSAQAAWVQRWAIRDAGVLAGNA